MRIEPDFICLGANKAGTTFFYNLLKQNNMFFKAKQKEFNLFGYDDLSKKEIKEYFKSFKNKDDKIAYDLSTVYFRHAYSIETLSNLMPDKKYILFLRHPSKRAISHHHFNNFLYNENHSLNDTINTYKLNKFNYNSIINKRKKNKEHLMSEVIDSSFYYKKLRKIYQFVPKENLFIIIFEEFIQNPQKTMDDFHSFLKIPGFSYEINTEKMETTKTPEVIRIPIKAIDKLLKLTPKKVKDFGLRCTKYIKRKTGHKVNKEDDLLFLEELNNIFLDDVNQLSLLINKDVKKIWKI